MLDDCSMHRLRVVRLMWDPLLISFGMLFPENISLAE